MAHHSQDVQFEFMP